MRYKFQYRNEQERQGILDDNKDKRLIEEQNITEGNFLIFTDEVPISERVASNTDYLLDVDFRLIMEELGL